MTTIPAKRYKRQTLPDPFVVLTYTLVLGTLLLILAYTSTFHTSPDGAFRVPSMGNISANLEASFAADLQYWDANCSHVSDSNPACDMISARAQSCEISTASRYCSEYKSYMQQFLNR